MPKHDEIISLFVWLWLVVNNRKFSAGTVFFSHANQPAVLLYKPATKRTSQPNRLHITTMHNNPTKTLMNPTTLLIQNWSEYSPAIRSRDWVKYSC